MTTNQKVLTWLEEMKALTQPDNVVWITGEEDQLKALRAEAVASGELIKLNEEKLPGCYLHRTAENDVARVEDRTFICTTNKEDAGPTNNWMAPAEMYAKLREIYDGSMKGRTMYLFSGSTSHMACRHFTKSPSPSSLRAMLPIRVIMFMLSTT